MDKAGTKPQDLGTSAIARGAACSEGTVRRLEQQGVVKLRRDSAGRRLGTDADVAAIKAHLARRA